VENPNHKGNVAELAIATEAARHGLSVLKPLTEHEPYDLALGIGRRLLRVQCKWARKAEEVIIVNLARNRRGPTGYIRRSYSPTEIDAVAAYCGELDSCFLIPIEQIAGQWAIQLRLAPTRNGQRAALHFADEYRLGAVAQLAERPDGIRKAGGSNPPSSTSSASEVFGGEEVGAHRFRNHLGYYMERASKGADILISRHGRPFARLGPVAPKP
jgi:prevent-host-death family protein